MIKRRYLILLFITFTLVGLLHSGARISEFHARRENNTVVLEWATEEESNLLRFDLQRSSDNVRWLKIGEKPAAGESTTFNQYSFIDQTVFKTTLSNFYYRLVMVDKNGQTTPYDIIASVSGSSGIVHTWGSIKAMFR